MAVATPYRGTLSLQRTGGTVYSSYSVARVADGAVVMQHSSAYDGAPMNAFDTVAFYLSRTSGTYEFRVTAVTVERGF